MSDMAPLTFGLAGWRCRLRADTWEAYEWMARAYAGSRADDGGAAVSTLEILFRDGPASRLRWSRGGRPADLAPLFAGPDGKRFPAVAHPARRLYADTVFGEDPALELHEGELHLLRSDSWPMYLSHVLTWLMLREHPLVGLHAAVCAAGGVALVIVGPSGCGKSTLSYALAQQGADYFSDEAAFLDRRDNRLYVRPHRVSLRPGGVAALAETPEEPLWYESKPGDLKCAPILPLPQAACPSGRSVLLFVDGFGDAPRLAPLGGGDAARRLAFVMGCGDPSPLARLEAAADIVSRLPCRALTIGQPEETARLLIAQAQEIG